MKLKEITMNTFDDIDPSTIVEFLPDFNELVVETAEGIRNIPIEDISYETIISFVTDGYLGVGILVAMGIEEFAEKK
jgi:hypothetical protein